MKITENFEENNWDIDKDKKVSINCKVVNYPK